MSFIEGDVAASVLQNVFQNSVKTELSTKTESQRNKWSCISTKKACENEMWTNVVL